MTPFPIPAAIAIGFLWIASIGRDRRSADERLAEIEAARAIPDSENAAMIYYELLQDPNATSIMDDFPESPAGDVLRRVRHEPWLSKDLPELATWVKEHQYLIDRLSEASRREKCRFPINIDIITPTSEMDRAKAMCEWGFLLTIAANNDLADERSENAMEKWRCLLRMGNHLCQHPIVMDHLLGRAVASMALEPMARLIVAGNATESCLQEIETLWLPNEEDWAKQLAAARAVEGLREQKLKESFGPGGRLVYDVSTFLASRTLNSALDDIADESRCAVRGIHILLALQRHRIATNHWPQSLDEIKASLSQETLTDPLNKGPFVYKPAGSTFVLYSKGKNNIEEHGERDPDTGVDDWPIWLPRGRNPEPKQKGAAGV